MTSTRRIHVALALVLPALLGVGTALAADPDEVATAPKYEWIGQDGDVTQFEMARAAEAQIQAARALVPAQPEYRPVGTDENGVTQFELRPEARATALARPIVIAPAAPAMEGATIDDSAVMQFYP